jgi:hypothetical protein
VILMCAMGSCIKVVKQKKLVSCWKKMLSPITVQNQNGHFSVMGIRKIINSRSNKYKYSRQKARHTRCSNYVFVSGYISFVCSQKSTKKFVGAPPSLGGGSTLPTPPPYQFGPSLAMCVIDAVLHGHTTSKGIKCHSPENWTSLWCSYD